MADKKLNDLAQIPSIGNLKNIYVEDANGNQYKVSKESLAEVLGGLIGDVSTKKAGLQPKAHVTRYMYFGSEDVYLRIAKLNNDIYAAGSIITCYVCWNIPTIFGPVSFLGYNKDISYVNISNITKNRAFYFDKSTGTLYAKMSPFSLLIVSVEFYNGIDDIYLDKIINLDISNMTQIII